MYVEAGDGQSTVEHCASQVFTSFNPNCSDSCLTTLTHSSSSTSDSLEGTDRFGVAETCKYHVIGQRCHVTATRLAKTDQTILIYLSVVVAATAMFC